MAELNEQDLYSMDLEELRKRAMQETSTEQPQAEEQQSTTQKRDDSGRFAKADTEDADEVDDSTDDAEDDEPSQKVFRRVVSIGDGVEPEVFEADSLEELVDKIADAKAHATRKIRAQEAELKKSREQSPAKPRQFSEDDEYTYSQELMQKPTQAFAKLFKEHTGMDISRFKTYAERVDAMETARITNESIGRFLATHPDYEDTQQNTDLMQLAMQGKEVNAENLEKAYQTLVSKGLLPTGKGKQNSVQEDEEQTKPGITAKPVATAPTQGTKKASGLKTRNTVPVKSQEPTEDELYNMPMEKLLELSNKQAVGR